MRSWIFIIWLLDRKLIKRRVPSYSAREVVKQQLNIQTEAFSEKYLGLPTAVGKLTIDAFEYITESARSSVNGWAEKNLSYPAEEMLIKSMFQAKPIHGMSYFLLSKGSCTKFTSIMEDFGGMVIWIRDPCIGYPRINWLFQNLKEGWVSVICRLLM
jgi:hypothetical protein